MRKLVLILAGGVLLGQQSLQQDMRNSIVEIPLPTSPTLDQHDSRFVLEAQRRQYYMWSEAYRKKVEYLEAEKAAWEADKAVGEALNNMRNKYHCSPCELDQDMKWYTPKGMKFAQPKNPE